MKNKFTFLLLFLIAFANSQVIDVSDVKFKNIGPTIMSGRVVDLAVNPENPTEFYVAYASGGLWYTDNNGTSFQSVMDTAPTLNCGSVTVNWKTDEIWVGTGEVNASRSSYAGIGLLKSSDKGKTWQNLGLKDSHHISRVWVNQNDSNEIIVAALGHLYTKNEQRGIFKTIDGGKTWKKTLFISDKTGIIDLQVVSENPKIMFAASWEKDRKAWNFLGNGRESGIYKSEDGGESWELISTENSGFPHDEGVGRIGLAVVNEKMIYAVLDNQNKRPNANKEKPKDANTALFETEVIGCELYKSVDGGKSWSKTHDNFIDDMFYSYGYYFANIAVNPVGENQIYIGGVPLLNSNDGGKTFKMISKENVHADHHVTWINPKNPKHIINGNDGGVNITYDNGEHWIKCNNESVGQFYAVQVDNQKPYNVYGGLQDNGVWVGPNDFEQNVAWHQEGKYPYQELMGGDGMQIQIDDRNSNIIYTGYQFGNYFRIDREKNETKKITPKLAKDSKEEPFRFNWQTPILLSSHNQDILYLGSNFLHRSMDKGETWEIISSDLTKGKVEGNVAFGTITAISESKSKFGLIYVGSDDGYVHVTKDGGETWKNLSGNLPQNLWISRIVASSHKEARVYVTLNGYRNDNFTSYIYVSEDYGNSWKLITKGIESSPVNVIYEDNHNENVLYVGTDNSLFASINRGENWFDFSENMPNVAVHDIKLQSEARELIVGTHGRSIYKVEVSNLEKLTNEILDSELYFFEIEDVIFSKNWGKKMYAWGDYSQPKIEFWIYSKSNRKTQFNVFNSKDKLVFKKDFQLKKGLNKVQYDLTYSKEKGFSKEKIIKADNGNFYLLKGKYKIEVEGKSKVFEIKEKDNK